MIALLGTTLFLFAVIMMGTSTRARKCPRCGITRTTYDPCPVCNPGKGWRL